MPEKPTPPPKRGPGRPPHPAESLRTSRLEVRLTPAELAALAAAARRAGQPLGTWLRGLGLAAAKR